MKRRDRYLIRTLTAALLLLLLLLGLCGATLAEGPDAPGAGGETPDGGSGEAAGSAETFVPRGTGAEEADVDLAYPENVRLSGSLPAAWDARTLGLTTAVKDQGANGLCWDFGTLAVVESNLLLHGYGTQDLSEMHMAYATSNHSGNSLGFDRAPGTGGNRYYSGSYLMRAQPLNGAVNEADDPYSTDSLPDRDLNVTAAKAQSFSVRNIYFLGEEKGSYSPAIIKDAVINYGSAAASMYIDMDRTRHENGSVEYTYFQWDSNAFYFDGSTDRSNHIVQIVGWDDNYSRENFHVGHRPPEDGAWLCKNSWSTEFGSDGGFFWISYSDPIFPSHPFTVDGVIPCSGDETLYMTDPMTLSWHVSRNAPELTVARVYTSKGGEALTHVRIFFRQPAESVEVDVVPNFAGFDDYRFTARAKLSVTYPGWYTIPLDAPVYLGDGEQPFALVARVENQDKVTFTYDKENAPPAGTSYISTSGKLQESDRNFCLRAITTRVSGPAKDSRTVSILASNGETAAAAAEIDGTQVRIGEIPAAEMSRLRGSLRIGLQGMEENLLSAVLPSSLLAWGGSEANGIGSLTLSFAAADLSLDTAAMQMLSNICGDAPLCLTASPYHPDSLNQAQRAALPGTPEPGASVSLSVGGSEIGFLYGARLAVSIPLAVSGSGREYDVWRADDGGAVRFRSLYDNRALTFRTGFPSADFVVVRDSGAAAFSDVSDNDYYTHTVDYVYRSGIMIGMGDGSFGSDLTLTRAMVAQLFYNLENGTPVKSTFSDVPENKWYSAAVGWAQSKGLVNGFEDGTFRPEESVTVEQLATLLNNYAKQKGYPVVLTTNSIISASGWAEDAFRWMTASSYLEGSRGTGGRDIASRIQVATALACFLESYVL